MMIRPHARPIVAALAVAFALAAGCDAPKTSERKIQNRDTVGKTTQDVRNLKDELAAGGQTADTKVKAKDYITLQSDVYKTSVAKIAQMKVKMDIDQYDALTGAKPKTYEEFMENIIKKGKPDGIQLPMLPFYQEYGYNPDTYELVVIEYPAKKKAFDEQWDKEVGRK